MTWHVLTIISIDSMPINFIVESIIVLLCRIKENVPFWMDFFYSYYRKELKAKRKEKWANNAKTFKKMPEVFSSRIIAVQIEYLSLWKVPWALWKDFFISHKLRKEPAMVFHFPGQLGDDTQSTDGSMPSGSVRNGRYLLFFQKEYTSLWGELTSIFNSATAFLRQFTVHPTLWNAQVWCCAFIECPVRWDFKSLVGLVEHKT